MYSTVELAKKYLSYYIHASNGKGHGIHSPFAFEFVRKVLNDRQPYPAYAAVEALRQRLRHDHSVLQVEDMGAGSGALKHAQKKVSGIARSVIKPRKYAQLLYRMVQHYRPATIVELGTSLGVTTAYLSLGNPAASVITLEGSPQVAAVAQKNFSALSLPNIRQVQGNFNDTLPLVLKETGLADLAFVDGNHAREPTLQYFEVLLQHINPSSIIIFDDIHWSAGMEEAWAQIKMNPAVTMSIDLFFIGLVFFREEFKVKQHFIIRY